MRSEEYECLDQLEDHMWWFKGLRGSVEIILSSRVTGRFMLLDAGCGTGGMLGILERRFPESVLHGIDNSPDACDRSRRKTRSQIVCGSVASLPYSDMLFDVITSLDVLEYDSVNIAETLREFRRCLKKDGLLLLNLPAYQWMKSYHDLAVGQARRFTLSVLKRELLKQGFNVVYGTYWNTIFFPLMVLRRKIFARQDGGSDVKAFPAVIDRVFQSAMRVEQAIINKEWSLPYGGSALVLAKRTTELSYQEDRSKTHLHNS